MTECNESYVLNRKTTRILYNALSRYSFDHLEAGGFKVKYLQMLSGCEFIFVWVAKGNYVAVFYSNGVDKVGGRRMKCGDTLQPINWRHNREIVSGFDAAIKCVERNIQHDDIGLHYLRTTLSTFKRERRSYNEEHKRDTRALRPRGETRLPEVFACLVFPRKKLKQLLQAK